MSGAPDAADPCGAASDDAGCDGDEYLTAMTRMRTTIDTAATAHGKGMVPFLSAAPPAGPPEATPHAWQNRAPGDSAVWHWLQLLFPSGVPQWVQNLPEAGLPQLGQFKFGEAWFIADPLMRGVGSFSCLKPGKGIVATR